MDNGKIIVFDSGLGGVFTLAKCMEFLPNEEFVYVADNAFMPYGNKTSCQVTERLISIFQEMMKNYKVKLFVIACNTATAVAIESLRKTFSNCFVGMQPPVKPAIEEGFENILVLVTELTKNKSEFLRSFQNDKRVIVKGYETLAYDLECGKESIDNIAKKVELSLSCKEKERTDCVVLGCSHFQLLKPYLPSLFSKKIKIIDSYEYIASRTRFVMNRFGKASIDGKPNLKVCLTRFDENFIKKFMWLLTDFRRKV